MGLFDRPPPDGRSAENAALRLLEEGAALEAEGRTDAALQRYDEALRLAPHLARAHFNRGNILLDLGDAEGALQAYAAALSHKPDSAAAHYNAGNACVRLGRYADGVSAYTQAIRLKPAFADAEVALGAALEYLGRPEDAVAHYRRALEISPDYAEAHCSLGEALAGLGKHDQAVESFGKALALRPAWAEAHFRLGNSLKPLGRLEEAAAHYRRALESDPGLAEAHYNHGVVLLALNQLEGAISSYRRALEIDPANLDACNGLGVVLNLAGQYDEAVACFRKALEIDPDFFQAHMNLGSVLKDIGRLEDAITHTRRALEINPDYAQAHSNLLFIHNYLGDQPASRLLEDARRYGASAARLARPYASWPNAPEPGRRLRIGLVSGDLCNHPVGFFAESVLAALSSGAAERLELHAYPSSTCDDATSRRIRACCRGWHSAVGLSDEALARRIRDHGIDILIDLSGHTAHGRLSMFAWKPAPVQVSWLGYFATTGVAEMDYFIADPWTLPESEEANFTERIWRLPETRLCFTPPAEKVDLAPLPALAAGSVTFGCFNNLTKMNDAVVALWARVLEAVPGSRLFLKSRQFSEASVRLSVGERFSARGIAADRLILEAHASRADYLAAYRRVDIALDPFPFTGGTTTAEALWMGVPVLTLAGERFLSRQGVGLLMNAGLPEWIAEDADDYVARAASHAADLHRLSALHDGLRQQVLSSPVFDAPRFARHFEAALRAMWEIWCRQHGPGASHSGS